MRKAFFKKLNNFQADFVKLSEKKNYYRKISLNHGEISS
jgi:hypothetical protein